MSTYHTQSYSRLNKPATALRDYENILMYKTSFLTFLTFFIRTSPQARYSKNQENLRESKSNDEMRTLRNLNIVSPLRVETQFQSKRSTYIPPTIEVPSKNRTNERRQSQGNMGNSLLNEAADIERLNEHLLDLTNNRLDQFMGSVKQFVTISNRMVKCVYPRTPDVETLLKNFHNQKAVVENNVVQMVSVLEGNGGVMLIV